MFFLCVFIIIPVIVHSAVICNPAANISSLFIFIDEEFCLITDQRSHIQNVVNETTKYFMMLTDVPCYSDINAGYWILIPDIVKPDVQVHNNLLRRMCNLERNNVFYFKCYFNFMFSPDTPEPTVLTEKTIQMSTVITSTTEPTVRTTTETTTVSTSTETTIQTTTEQITVVTTELILNTTEPTVNTSNKADSYLYVYVACGVVVFFLIVIIQTACIILYKRKVAKSRRTLNYVLNSRAKEMSEKKVRYSVGPVKKYAVKPIPQDEDENVYESMERIAEPSPRAKSTPTPVRSPRTETINRSLRERPKLPLPHEIQAIKYEDMRGNRPQMSTGVSIPHGLQSPRMEDLRGNRRPQTSTGVTLPQSPRLEDMRANPRPQTSSGITLPHGMQSPRVEAKSAEQPPFQPTANFPQPPASIARPRPQAPTPNIARIHAEKLRTIHEEPKRFSINSSDEEWTYEQLPPMEKYLHS